MRLRERVQVMGVLNRTPDSFSDGGTCMLEAEAVRRLGGLVAEGADIIDIGGESSRPGAQRVTADEQLDRVASLVERAVAFGAFVSVDTTLPEVAEATLSLGARMINSVSLEPAAELGQLVAAYGGYLVLTHCRGPMSEMRGFSSYEATGYDDVVADVAREWSEAASRALGAGLAPDRLVFDPGLGFTKNADQSLELCARLGEFRSLGHPILAGTSRKSYLAHVVAQELGSDPPGPTDRLGASIAAAIAAAQAGADIVRVHDVAVTRQALAYARVFQVRQLAYPWPIGAEPVVDGPLAAPPPVACGGDAVSDPPSGRPRVPGGAGA